MTDDRSFPTMIIPQGTTITVDDRGQLAIRTPGNLVIQNSGTYSVIECTNGSLRVDPNVSVEAVTVRAADTCYVAGTLTAWKVQARKIVLDKGSKAFIMLQEAESLDIDGTARIVGNFGSEKELYLMLGRFNHQLRDLPGSLAPGERTAEIPATVGAAPTPLDAPFPLESDASPQSSPDDPRKTGLERFHAALEREQARPELPQEMRDTLTRLQSATRSGDVPTMRTSFHRLLSRAPSPSSELQAAWNGLSGLLGDDPQDEA